MRYINTPFVIFAFLAHFVFCSGAALRGIEFNVSPRTPSIGDDWDENGLMVFFRGEAPLYFTGSIYNHSDSDCELGQWPKTLKISDLVILRYGGTTPTGPAAPNVLRTNAISDLNIQVIGPLQKESANKYAYSGNIVSSGGILPQKLKAHECCEFLVRIDQQRQIPCDYYVISISINTPSGILRDAARFLVRDVKEPNDQAFLQKQKAINLFTFGKTTEGLAALEKSLKIAPTSSWSWYNLGQFYELQGKLDEALEVYQRGAQCIPQSPATAEDSDIIIEKQGGFSIYKEINLNVRIDIVRKKIKREPINTQL
jgi:tetratricopeptide (TPR) repeat protein